ncbi:hypothetical protein DLJ49_12605 [Rhodovulum sp. 12E13]|uniref:hypothetical protein n=1 Tax=Rhodovulum sp. 12E13 TaxID=2203891 RepID=UPI000E185E9A|nr:hypothetical protein [Rhodovulum sp. 12E13]RDC71930.1 hypothetical protein DLJ49_12605 [Rhodovulum sp. 12E13]
MSDDRRIVRTVADANGAQWVHLTREEAEAHPKGRPGLVLWALAAWFAASGGLEVALALAAGAPVWTGALGLVSLVAAVGLILRVPWAYVLAVLLPARFVIGFVQTIGGGAQELTGAPQAEQVFVLVQAAIAVLAIFYLVEGERPNLIYRHRFRSYTAERQVEEERRRREEEEEKRDG